MKSIVLSAILLATSVLILASCGNDESDPTGIGPGSYDGTIRVVDDQFIPADVTISAGDSVTWSFEGSKQHTVTEGTGPTNPNPLFDSGLRSSGTFGYRFANPGDYAYYCSPHFSQGMKGIVRVEP